MLSVNLHLSKVPCFVLVVYCLPSAGLCFPGRSWAPWYGSSSRYPPVTAVAAAAAAAAVAVVAVVAWTIWS